MNPTSTSLNLGIQTASRRALNATAAGLLVALALGAAGCDGPPFDLTGTYHGTWEAPIFAEDDPPVVCPLTLKLHQDVQWYYWLVGLNVLGTASFDALCFLPEPLARLFEYNSLEVALMGEATSSGAVQLQSGGCLGGDSFCVVLRLDGIGIDANRDKIMDVLTGDMRFYFAVEGMDRINVNATFDVELAYEPPAKRGLSSRVREQGLPLICAGTVLASPRAGTVPTLRLPTSER